jgi:iron(III) transport system substrate-binding protein
MGLSRRTLLQGGTAIAASAAIHTGRPARAAASNDSDALYAAAKREGTFSLYTGAYEQATTELLRDAFKAKYPGIEVEVLRQASQTVYTRLRLEMQNGDPHCDVLSTTNLVHYLDLKKVNALASYVPADNDKVVQAFRSLDPDNTFQIAALSLTSINYATRATNAPPQSWTALLDDKWHGKITTGSPAFSGDVASWVVAIRHKYGDDFLRRFGQQSPKVGTSNVDTVTDLLAGERAVGSGAPFSYTLVQKAAGNPIDVVTPTDDTILNAGPAAVLAKAPHPNAARLYMNFINSIEYSQILSKNFWPTLRTDVPWAEGRSFATVKWYRNPIENLSAEVAEGIAKWKELVR